MTRLRVLAALALAGFALAVWAVLDAGRKPPAPPPPPTPRPPFADYVAAVGITETGRGNIAIGTPVAGIVQGVDVRVGDRVTAGDVLFRIDDRDVQAQRRVALADVAQAEAAIAQPRHRLDYLQAVQRLDGEVVSRETISNARDEVRMARAARDAARAHAARLDVDLARLQVRAPAAGRVLQVNVRPGEFAAAGTASPPPVLLGDDARVYVRVDIDENDAWRVRPGAEGRAFIRGDPRISIPLRYEYVEPYVVPKTSLTGQATERTDVRVLQVVYSFARDGLPVYLGQQMDVFVRAAPDAAPAGRR